MALVEIAVSAGIKVELYLFFQYHIKIYGAFYSLEPDELRVPSLSSLTRLC